jgi:hypothetical protein
LQSDQFLELSIDGALQQTVRKSPSLILAGANVAIKDRPAPATDGNFHFIETERQAEGVPQSR